MKSRLVRALTIVTPYLGSNKSRSARLCEGALARHRVKSGKQTLKILVSQQPSRAGVDPEGKLIERVRKDNVVKVTE